MSEKVFKPHSQKQQKAVLSNNSILLLATGTQWGKTNVGAVRMKIMLHTFTKPNDNFLITSPSYKIMQQSTLPAFLYYMDGYGVYDKKFDIFRMYNGGTVYCRTETDPDSIVGITNVKHIWADEAGKYRQYFWENIQARADFCGCKIDLTTSPYSINWIYKELIKPSIAGKRSDVDYITAASWDNPYHSLYNMEKRRLKESTMDQRRFRMIFGGAFEKMEGLVYDCFNEDEHQCDPFTFPVGTKYFGGIDWGFNPDPFVLKVRAITTSGHHFSVSEHYQTRLTISDILTICRQKKNIYGIERFYADPSQPGYIDYLSQNGIPIVGAINDIRIGIDTHYELIKSGKYKLFKGANPYTVDEYSSYHYPEPDDLGPDDNSKENLPVDQNNHIMDAERYLSMMTYKSTIKHTPKTPDIDKAAIKNDHEKRIKELMKPKKRFNGSETW